MFRVLVVDDDNALRLTVSSSFQERNYQVEQACDGEEAVNKVMSTNRLENPLFFETTPNFAGLIRRFGSHPLRV